MFLHPRSPLRELKNTRKDYTQGLQSICLKQNVIVTFSLPRMHAHYILGSKKKKKNVTSSSFSLFLFILNISPVA